LERGDAAEVRPRSFTLEPFGVVAGGDEERGGGVGTDAVQLEQPGRGHHHELRQKQAEAVELLVEPEDAPAEGLQRDLGAVRDDIAIRSRA
jgi:hypothetical protein